MAVSDKSRIALWVRSAGRCEYLGCNKPLLGEAISGRRLLNTSYIAYIVGERPGGPRGNPVRSPQLADDVENLLLLCDVHHRLIDRDGVDDHPEARLLEMKRRHESRVAAATDISDDMGSHVLLYAARVGEHDCPARFDLAKAAMLPDRWPAEPHAVHLELSGVDLADHEEGYWRLQQQNLRRQFERRLRDHLANGDIRHLSVFALAPQPLLMELGRLLGDITPARVHQLHREPQGWNWRSERPPIDYVVSEPAGSGPTVALRLALSATVTDQRIQDVLGADVPIWSLTTPQPHNDVLHREGDLAAFRGTVRSLLDRIKARHGENATIHVFPALPVSAAVEVGRVWMPKADLTLRVYDQDRHAGCFVPRITIGSGHADRDEELQSKELAHG